MRSRRKVSIKIAFRRHCFSRGFLKKRAEGEGGRAARKKNINSACNRWELYGIMDINNGDMPLNIVGYASKTEDIKAQLLKNVAELYAQTAAGSR